MLDFIKQISHRDMIVRDPVKEKVYTPDFTGVSQLYKEFGINNDIDLAMRKPQYQSIVDQRLAEIPVNPSPSLDDNSLADNLVSRSLDVNEVREYAEYQLNEADKFKKEHNN